MRLVWLYSQFGVVPQKWEDEGRIVKQNTGQILQEHILPPQHEGLGLEDLCAIYPYKGGTNADSDIR